MLYLKSLFDHSHAWTKVNDEKTLEEPVT